MSESGRENLRSRLDLCIARLTGETGTGWFRPDRLLLDLAGSGWLAYAFASFRGHPGAAVLFALGFSLVAAPTQWLYGGHGRSRFSRLGGAFVVLACLTCLAWISGGWTSVNVTWAAAFWLAGATSLSRLLSSLALRQLELPPGRRTLAESLRCVVLLAAAVYAVLPYYTDRPVGAGDAGWYTLMLADYAEQIRLGAFPVWLGQTEFAFNGAFSPLRLAPWFQHAGGLLDQLTGRSLDYGALKNALLALNAVALAFSGYFFLRTILSSRPTTAAGLTVILLLSPATLAPLYIGDQYMTFMALPFLPAVCYGLWRAYERNDFAAHFVLAAGVAGLWLAHSPIALWSSALAFLAYLGKIALHRGRGEPARLALGLAVFLAFGAWPLLSAVSLDNVVNYHMDVDSIYDEIVRAFPANLGRLSSDLSRSSDYQPGFAMLGVLATALLMLPARRSWIAFSFFLGLVFLAIFTLPVPGVSGFLWQHAPAVVAQITNSWPMQRLVPIAGCLIVFLFAVVCPPPAAGRRAWIWPVLFLLSLPLLGWSCQELGRMQAKARSTTPRDESTSHLAERHNLSLSRYCYASFAAAPPSFSHGYMDPVLEHRLLRRNLQPLASNQESAARKGALPAPDPDGTALLAHGVLRAINDQGSPYYNLKPQLTLPARTHLALWLDPLDPGQSGWLQIQGQNVFREYLLPDSGAGVERHGLPRSFGTLPSSSNVISLYSRHTPADRPQMVVIAPQRTVDPSFDFARYELWRYDPETLPVTVKSWVPYRVIINSPEPAYLETPRMWLGGYRAKINGVRVPGERSPDNLVMFAVPAGSSDATIKFVPSLCLEVVYWVSLIAWSSLALTALAMLIPRPQAGWTA